MCAFLRVTLRVMLTRVIAFQSASGFAAAKVLYNIGPAPFVDPSGFTVEAFEVSVCAG